MQISIQEVDSAKDRYRFHSFTRNLYKNDPEYVSHIDQDIEAIFDRNKNSEFENGDAKRWLAYQNNKIVGKIAAFYNKNTNQSGIGFFDSI
ncbi:MAG: hypothetical protein ACPGYY_10150, partial [Bacteroidia bacterium]